MYVVVEENEASAEKLEGASREQSLGSSSDNL